MMGWTASAGSCCLEAVAWELLVVKYSAFHIALRAGACRKEMLQALCGAEHTHHG